MAFIPEDPNNPLPPNDPTEQAATTPAVPNDPTEQAATTPAVPNDPTEQAATTPAVPNDPTEQAVAGYPRTLTPSLCLAFDSDAYSIRGSAKTFAETFTYSRASSATFVNRRINQQGRYEYFLDTDYVGTVENLITWSENYADADWAKQAGASVTLQSGNIEGSPIFKLSDSSASGSFLRQILTIPNDGISRNFSVYFKNVDSNYINMVASYTGGTAQYNQVTIDANSGEITDKALSPIFSSEHIRGGWFRLSISTDNNTSGNTSLEVRVYPAYNNDGTTTIDNAAEGSILLSKAQLTESFKPLPYVKTTSVAASQVFSESLRRGWDLQGNCLAALFERGSTNLFVYSENLSNPAWTKQNSTLGSSQIKAPDGTFSAYKLIPDSAANGYLTQTTSFTSGQSYTCSVFAKAGEFSQVRILAQAGWAGSTFFTEFDLSTGEILSQQTDGASIEYLWDGWYRISATHEATVTGNSSWQVCRSTDSGDGSSGYYVWASQNENTPYPTSYIMTEGSTATRSSDDLTLISYSSHPRIETGQELSFFAECRTLSSNTSSDNRAVFSTSTIGGRFNLLRIDSSVQFYDYYRAGASDSFSTGTNIDEYKRLSGSVSKSDFVSLYENGILTDTNTKSPNFQGALSQFFIGRYTATGHLDGYIKRIAIYDVELTAQEVSLL